MRIAATIVLWEIVAGTDAYSRGHHTHFRFPSSHSLSPQFAFQPADRRVGRLGLRAARRERPEVSDFVRYCPAGKDFARRRVIDDEPYHPRLGNSRKNGSGPRRRRVPRAEGPGTGRLAPLTPTLSPLPVARERWSVSHHASI